jgi:uncharacterized membrane protein YraQ (UPF0718 family)
MSDSPKHCCGDEGESSCCDSDQGSWDYLLWGSFVVCLIAVVADQFFLSSIVGFPAIAEFCHSSFELLGKMWFGVVIGIVLVGILHQVPKEVVMRVIGRRGSVTGIFRAMLGGLFFDLCNHGILMIGINLYKKGASLGQVFAFLIASPWNSFSLTIILSTLIGVPNTILFVFLSALIAFITGIIVDKLIYKTVDDQDNLELMSWSEVWSATRKEFSLKEKIVFVIFRDGFSEAKMILKWILFGVVLASAIRAFVDPQIFQEWFGPTIGGLFLTLIGATIIEVCSEGSIPIASDLAIRAHALGNSFTFLMAGAATDYTEIMSLKEVTKRWRQALLLPLLTVPQVLILGYLLNCS